MQSSAPNVTCLGGPPANGTSQICHGWSGFCLPDTRTYSASGDSAASAETVREGARSREALLNFILRCFGIEKRTRRCGCFSRQPQQKQDQNTHGDCLKAITGPDS